MKNNKKLRWIRATLLLIAIVCLIPVGQAYYLSYVHQRQQEKLQSLLNKDHDADTELEEESEKFVSKNVVNLENLKDLHAQNSDLAGWLTVEGTDITYPVMQCIDDEYYLNHNFYKKKDKYGCLYVKSIADLHTPGTNFIIYGHNMKDGAMFGELDQYKSESYYKDHSQISFATLKEERTYEVMAVFEVRIEETSAFKYYQFYQADTEEEFLNFYENVRELSLYDTKVTAEFGDTFLTLSTCLDYGKNGRFIVVAKRLL